MELLLAVLVIGIAFYLLSIVTEDFFVPAIDRIADKLKMSSDAAGATLLAMGSSAPEFFTSFFAVMGLAGAGHADIGAGAIVGSAIFNVLVIVGAAAMFKAVKLQWQPVIRDQVFYILTILLLLWAFWDGSISLVECLIFIGAYGVYVFTVVKWRKWLKYEDSRVEDSPDEDKNRNSFNKVVHGILQVILPNPKTKLYPLTFLVSILAIAGLSWLLVQKVVVISEILNINPTFLALTVLAVGTSLPDLIGSIVVAKQGRGDMAVSNAIGSNIFDVLFGLGMPWMVYILINGGTVSVGKENLLASVLLLFATVIAMLFLLVLRNWKIGHKSGLLLIALYVIYCIYTILSVA